jgi:hypothetical protein
LSLRRFQHYLLRDDCNNYLQESYLKDKKFIFGPIETALFVDWATVSVIEENWRVRTGEDLTQEFVGCLPKA